MTEMKSKGERKDSTPKLESSSGGRDPGAILHSCDWDVEHSRDHFGNLIFTNQGFDNCQCEFKSSARASAFGLHKLVLRNAIFLPYLVINLPSITTRCSTYS